MVYLYVYVFLDYIQCFGSFFFIEDIDNYWIIIFGEQVLVYFKVMNWLDIVGCIVVNLWWVVLKVNNIVVIKCVVQIGVGIVILFDYIIDGGCNLVLVFMDEEDKVLFFDIYFVYLLELKNMVCVIVFWEFFLKNVQNWVY